MEHREGKRAAQGITRRRLLVCGLLCVLGWSGAVSAEVLWLRRQPLLLREGLVLDFWTRQEHGFQDTYTSRVVVEEVSRGAQAQLSRVRFRWRMFEAQRNPGYDETGVVTTTGLARSRSFNAWWSSDRAIVTSDTQLWLSQEACGELASSGETRFALDRNVRRDQALRLTRVGEQRFAVEVNGKEARFPAWELRSERGDWLVVLADCDHPLVLEAKLPGLYECRLERAQTSP